MNILDIDLDFFIDKIVYLRDLESEERADSNFYHPWTSIKLKKFLERQCKLNSNNRIRGKHFTHHIEMFNFLKSMQEENNFQLTFNIDHIDGHADLGLGDSSYVYICTKLLNYEHSLRYKFSEGNISSGNFLAFMSAFRWINQLNYIYSNDKGDDIAWIHSKDFNIDSGFLQLKKFTVSQITEMTYGNMHEIAKNTTPLAIEPEIPFKRINGQTFSSGMSYDYVFITKSPAFTPIKSDSLLPIFDNYITIF